MSFIEFVSGIFGAIFLLIVLSIVSALYGNVLWGIVIWLAIVVSYHLLKNKR